MGRRRLHLFGRDSTIRAGWLTVGQEITNSNFEPETYASFFSSGPEAHLTGCTEEVERLRPKSPTPKSKQSGGNDRGRGGGRGRGMQGGPTLGGPNRGGMRGMLRGGPLGRGLRGGFRGRGGFKPRGMRDDMR